MIKFFDIANQDKKYFNEIIFNLKSNIKKTDLYLEKMLNFLKKSLQCIVIQNMQFHVAMEQTL